jgi:3-oxoacyl-[acyl-carrier protein] reductase
LNKQGVIINVSSCVGETGNAFQAVYSATKAGLAALSKSLAREVSALSEEHTIRILSIAPGFIETEMTGSVPEKFRQEYLKAIPANRFGNVNEVADVVAFLLSDKASYINGTNININGGIL